MLDIKYIKENIDLVKLAVKNKKAKVDIDKLLELDSERRKLVAGIEALNQEKNEAAKSKNVEKGKMVKENLSALESEFKEVEQKYLEAMYAVPNIPSEDTPVGPDEAANEVVKKVGDIPKFDFEPKEHWQLGHDLNVIDNETAAEVAGSRFTYLKGELALMEFALIQFILGILTDESKLKEIADEAGLDINTKPFVAIVPPVFIKPEVFQRMGRLEPKEERYHIPSDDLYLIGSAEHTLGPIHMDQVIAEKDLPIRYIGFSTSFRREAGSYGKDTKGILRMHQFDKLEMESFTVAEQSTNEQNFLVAIQEYILKSLGISYQVVQISTGDMGGPDYRQVDLEAFMPGQNKYRETHTSDNMTDYQSRRLNIKVKRGDKTELVHMNDATAAAIGRALIAIMENYQQKDGSIKIPEALKPYMFGVKEIKRK